MIVSDTMLFSAFSVLGAAISHLYWDRHKLQKRVARVEAALGPAGVLSDSVSTCVVSNCPHRQLAQHVGASLKKVAVILILCVCLFSASACTSFYGDANTGKFFAGSVLGNIRGLAVTPSGAMAEEVNHDEANKSVRTYLYADAAKAITGTLTKGWVKTTASKEATKRVGLQETTEQVGLREATKQAAITAEAQKAALP